MSHRSKVDVSRRTKVSQLFDRFIGGGDEGSDVVMQLLERFFVAVDLGEHGEHALDDTFVVGAEDFGESFVEHGGFLWSWRAWALKLVCGHEAAGRLGGVV